MTFQRPSSFGARHERMRGAPNRRRLILDAYPIIAYLRDEPVASEVEALLESEQAVIPSVVLGEALDVMHRRHGISVERLQAGIAPLRQAGLDVAPVPASVAWRACALRGMYYRRTSDELSLPDCFLVAAAGPRDVIVTADPPVLRMARAEGLNVVALPDSLGVRH
jgi:uncharacterized protein with PIN domain